jgi:putative ABC transport system ATP-binding protein
MNAPESIVKTELLHLASIRKSYRLGQTEVPALKDVTLSIERGEFTALMGPSGSGKSTLLNICGLIDRPDAGVCRMGGEDTTIMSEEDLTYVRRERIGFVFQGFNLVPVMTVAENVELPLLLNGEPSPAREGAVRDVLEQVGLTELSQRRPDELSGGQRQRVAIARALVKSPQLVIADEPTANLDGETARQIISLMHELGRSGAVTFLIATHDSRMADRCDRLVRMSDGVLQ